MFPGIGTILSLVTGLGPTITSIGKQIGDYKIQKGQTESAREKQKLDQQIAEAHDRRDVIVAEAGNRLAVFMKGIVRGLIIAGPLSYILKISLWDKVIGSFVGCSAKYAGFQPMGYCYTFVTDSLNINLDATTGAILSAAIAFYLMYDIASISRKK